MKTLVVGVMTDDEIKAAIDRGFATGLRPTPVVYLDDRESPCGCAHGALWLGTGRTFDEYAKLLLKNGSIWPGLVEVLGVSEDWSDGCTAGFFGHEMRCSDPGSEYTAGYRIGQWALAKYPTGRDSSGWDPS